MKKNNKRPVLSYRRVQQLTIKKFLLGGVLFCLTAGACLWISQVPKNDSISRVLRASLNFSSQLWAKFYSPDRRVFSKEIPPPGAIPRLNGKIGLGSPIDVQKWRLHVFVENHEVQSLSIAQVKWLPKTFSDTQFFCIEGWSTNFSYSGVKFSDFLKIYGLSNQYRYVGFETPDRNYYVSLDMESMLHSQTLLAYEMNGFLLAPEHGAPLRLVIPIKYGIKSLKRIGKIRLSNTRPPDYWEERGYDWYAGL